MATVREYSRKILHLYARRRMPSPQVTLQGDHSVSLMKLQVVQNERNIENMLNKNIKKYKLCYKREEK